MTFLGVGMDYFLELYNIVSDDHAPPVIFVWEFPHGQMLES